MTTGSSAAGRRTALRERLATVGAWVLLLSTAGAGLAAALLLVRPEGLPDVWLRDGGSAVLLRAWAATWLVLALLAAVPLAGLTAGAARAGRERVRPPAAAAAAVSVPAIWLVHALLAPGALNVALTVATALACAAVVRPLLRSPHAGRRESPG